MISARSSMICFPNEKKKKNNVCVQTSLISWPLEWLFLKQTINLHGLRHILSQTRSHGEKFGASNNGIFNLGAVALSWITIAAKSPVTLIWLWQRMYQKTFYCLKMLISLTKLKNLGMTWIEQGICNYLKFALHTISWVCTCLTTNSIKLTT